jgi:hypothetical protein
MSVSLFSVKEKFQGRMFKDPRPLSSYWYWNLVSFSKIIVDIQAQTAIPSFG